MRSYLVKLEERTKIVNKNSMILKYNLGEKKQ